MEKNARLALTRKGGQRPYKVSGVAESATRKEDEEVDGKLAQSSQYGRREQSLADLSPSDLYKYEDELNLKEESLDRAQVLLEKKKVEHEQDKAALEAEFKRRGLSH